MTKSDPKGKLFQKLDVIKSCYAIENNQLKCVIIQFYFQCAWMTTNNISTSGGLTRTAKKGILRPPIKYLSLAFQKAYASVTKLTSK